MSQHEFNKEALKQKSRSERLYIHYTLALATFLILLGVVLMLLGLGNSLDIVIAGGGIEGRFINASPGIALTLIGAAIFVFSKPRKLVVRHGTTKQSRETITAEETLGDIDDSKPARRLPLPPQPGETIAQVTARLRAHANSEATSTATSVAKTTKIEDHGDTLYQRGGYESVNVEELKREIASKRSRRDFALKNDMAAIASSLTSELNALELLLQDETRLRALRARRGE